MGTGAVYPRRHAAAPVPDYREFCGKEPHHIRGRSCAMNTLDESALHGLNTLAGKSPVFDSVMAFFSVADLVKGGAFCLVVWWFWFLPRTRLEQRRDLLIAM